MMGFVTTEPWQAPGRIQRWRCGWQKGYATKTREGRFFGRPALYVQYKEVEGLNPRQAAFRKRGLRQILTRGGVDTLAFSTWGDVLEGTGPRRMESGYLHLYLAGDVGVHTVGRDDATAVCFFHRVGHLEERALLKLAARFRYLMITSQRDEAALCHALRRRYGLPVVGDPTPSQVRRADFALVSGPVPKAAVLGGHCLAFAPDRRLFRHIPGGRHITGLSLNLPENVAEEIPEGFLPDPLLSEAVRSGCLDPGKIKIHGLSIDKADENDYNTLGPVGVKHETGARQCGHRRTWAMSALF